jgi:integrase
MIVKLDAQIEAMMLPFRAGQDLLTTIPGIGPLAAAAILSEIGTDVAGYFPDAAHLASWAGLCPGNHESTGKRHGGRRRPGNQHLQPVLVETAWAAVRHEGYLKALYHRHVMKWGGYRSPTARKRAIIVVAHTILVIIWHVLAGGTTYDELGTDFFTRRLDPERETRRLIANLKLSATRSAFSQPPAPQPPPEPMITGRGSLPRLGEDHSRIRQRHRLDRVPAVPRPAGCPVRSAQLAGRAGRGPLGPRSPQRCLSGASARWGSMQPLGIPACRGHFRREPAMHPRARAHVLSSLAVVLYVAAPATVMLTAHETVRIDRLEHSAGGVTASRHGELLQPGTSTIQLDRGTYHFRTAGDARLHVTDPASVTMTTSQALKCPPPPFQLPSAPDDDALIAFPQIRGGGMPDHIPALTLTYGDAA